MAGKRKKHWRREREARAVALVITELARGACQDAIAAPGSRSKADAIEDARETLMWCIREDAPDDDPPPHWRAEKAERLISIADVYALSANMIATRYQIRLATVYKWMASIAKDAFDAERIKLMN